MITEENLSDAGVRLIKKLKKYGALEAFVMNCNKETLKHRLIEGNHSAADIIDLSFCWVDTPQGGQFWVTIHQELCDD